MSGAATAPSRPTAAAPAAGPGAAVGATSPTTRSCPTTQPRRAPAPTGRPVRCTARGPGTWRRRSGVARTTSKPGRRPFGVDSTHNAGPVSDAAGSNDLDSLTSSSTGKRRSAVWDDFTEVTENRNGKKVCIAGICKFCKARLSANSNAGIEHLLRHQKSCKNKSNHATMVQTRLALNLDGS
jgi:transposase